MEDDLIYFFENQNDDLKKWKMTSKKIKMEDDLKKNEIEGRQPKNIKWKTNQSTKINLIGCETIVNSPSFVSLLYR